MWNWVFFRLSEVSAAKKKALKVVSVQKQLMFSSYCTLMKDYETSFFFCCNNMHRWILQSKTRNVFMRINMVMFIWGAFSLFFSKFVILMCFQQMQKKRLNGSFQRSDSQQAVKSPPLLVGIEVFANGNSTFDMEDEALLICHVFQDSPDPSREQVVKLSVSCFSFPYNQLAL